MKYILLVLSLLSSIMSQASSLALDIGSTDVVFNRFSIPGEDGSRISLPSTSPITSYRLTGYIDLKNSNQLYFLLAPLETNNKFISKRSFQFNDSNFSNNTSTSVLYKFNSYRVGYLWKWHENNLRYWVGAVGKIRDAEVKVSQGALSESFDNIGFVPLLAFGFDWKIWNNLHLFSHTDALGAPQGSAYDSQLELKYSMKKYSVSLGKRIFGGGADNEKVYTFAQFDTLYLRLALSI